MRETNRNKQVDYIIAIIVNVIVLYVGINLLKWHVPYVKESFAAVLPALYLSTGSNILGNALFLINTGTYLQITIRLIINLFSFYFLYRLYVVFPFDFSAVTNWFNTAVKVGLVLGMIGVIIGADVDISGILISRKNINP